jgi:hypothetical protein
MTDETPAFAGAAAGALIPVAGAVGAVRQKAEVGGLRLDLESANALLRQLGLLRQRVAGLVEDSAALDTPLRFGDNWIGRIMSERLRTVAVDRQHGVGPVLDAFATVLNDLEYTIRAAAGLYYTTDQESAIKFQQAVEGFGLEVRR